MKRPTTHKWLPFYFWILFAGIGPTAYAIYKALNISGSGGYICLASVLIAIRAVTCWGLFARKLWGWHLNFIALFLIPIVKVLIPLMYSYNAYDVKQLGGSAIAVSFFWLIYAIPNTIYFKKRKYLFDDGKGLYKTLFGGSGFRVLDPQSVSGFTASDAPSLGRTVEVPSIAVERITVAEKMPAEVPVEAEECVLVDEEMEVEMAAINLNDKSDEQFYEVAAAEYDSGKISKGLMLKAEVAAAGDKDKSRLFCIRIRAKEIAQEEGKKANEERDLASLWETLGGAVEDSGLEDNFLKQMKNFRADYPDNVEIDELQAELEYRGLKNSIGFECSHLPAQLDYEKRLQMYDSFLAENPEHLRRHEIEKNRSQYEGELGNLRDRRAFSDVRRDAQEFIKKHKYQEAIDLYRGYLDEYSERANEARKMIDDAIPKLIEDEPNRKRRVKRKVIVTASIMVVLILIVGVRIWYHKHDAAFELEYARRYYHGQGVPKDHALAIELLQKAADQDYAPAQAALGVSLASGDGGLAPDYTTAVKWYRKAAEQGDANAQVLLGGCYLFSDRGVDQDVDKALTLIRPLAEQGHPSAQNIMGIIMRDGLQEVAPNAAEASEWFRKAARQGSENAQKHLDAMLSESETSQESTDSFAPAVDALVN